MGSTCNISCFDCSADSGGKSHGARDGRGIIRLTYNVKSDTSQYMIRTFSSKKTERLFNREAVKEFANIASVAQRRLFILNSARVLADLLVPPGNRLEALQGDREGQHSIRINNQYRVCFTWKEDGPHDVEITKHYR